MGRFAVRRLVNMVATLFAISVLTFLIFNIIPGGGTNGAVLRIAGRNANAQQRQQVKEKFDLDKPFPVQYAKMMTNVFDGSLKSYSNEVNVRQQLIQGLPATASLVIGAAVIWVFFGVAFGVIMALNAGKWPDRVLTILSMVGISLPVFWVGLVLLYYLTFRWPIFPPGDYVPLTQNPISWFTHLILPWFTLSILFIGFYARLLRSNVLDTMSEDYVRTARAKGLLERRILIRHVLRNALIPIVTLFGLDFGAAFGGGAILTESVFNLNGIGQYAADSIGSLDLPPIMGVTLWGASFIVLLSTLVDIAYAFLDPRIRLAA